MKKITYQDIVEFQLPDHWVVEELDGAGLFYEHGDDVNTLRLELLVVKSPKPVDENTSAEMLAVLSKGGSKIVSLDNGKACKCYFEEIVEQGQKLLIHYWYVANAVKPNIGKLATFSFTTLSKNREYNETLQIIGMLDKEIRACKFL
ncbi:hypothetical protein K5N70_000811 [Vibrio vulnificus]|nr:hypothetical protein [Vibrio vulnificus]